MNRKVLESNNNIFYRESQYFVNYNNHNYKISKNKPTEKSVCYNLKNNKLVFVVSPVKDKQKQILVVEYTSFMDKNIPSLYITPIRNIVQIDLTENEKEEIFENILLSGRSYFIMKEKYPEYVNEEKSAKCEICGNPVLDFDELEDKFVCKDCFEKYYKYCEKCCEIFLVENEKENLCPKCAKRNYILPYHHYTPEIKFFGDTENNKLPYLGIELEVDYGGQEDCNAEKAMSIMNEKDTFVYTMRDGSLDDGFEIITQPATLKYHKYIKDKYNDMFNFLLSKNYLSQNTKSCALHVHFNRDFYQENEKQYIFNLIYLINKFWDKIILISRRKENEIERFSKKVKMPFEEYYNDANKSKKEKYHYYSVNISNENTIEIRIFKGTLNIDMFFKTLEFINNCIICAKIKTIEEIDKMNFKELFY